MRDTTPRSGGGRAGARPGRAEARPYWGAAGLVLLLAGIAAGETTGGVRDAAGGGVAGAMVTATDPVLRRGTTVYTGGDGCFRLPEPAAGVYDLRVRRFGCRDLEMRRTVLPALSLRLTVDAEPDPRARAWSLPASRWLPLLLARLPGDAPREEFLRQCAFCHQQGSWATRVPRPREDWEKILTLMGRMGGIVSAELRAALPEAFNAAYDPAAAYAMLDTAQVAPLDAAAGSAVITEWELGGPASTQHDFAVHPDGTIYSVDTNQDKLYRQEEGFYPHTLRFDAQGRLWYTLWIAGFSAGLVARYDPRAQRFDTWRLPVEGVETPYALNVDRRTDTVWICGTNSDSLIRFEPEAQRFTVYPLPTRVTYTREIDFDADGGVWTSNSNFPTWQIESAQLRVLRLQP